MPLHPNQAVPTMTKVNQSAEIEGWIGRLKGGDVKAREQLINCTCERLTSLTRKMLKEFGRVKRWEQTDDVVQNSLMRLYRTLADVHPANAVEFYRLASMNIRRELLDLAKHYFGPNGLGANYASVDFTAGKTVNNPDGNTPQAIEDSPDQLEAWTAFHEQVEKLPDEEKEVFDLLWYQELSQAEVAELLHVSTRTVKRRWASARLLLHEALGGLLPEI